jgi:uncharacterized protein YjlB
MLMVLAGTVRIGSTAEAAAPEVFSQGDTVLLPASLGQAELTTTAGARWLEISFTQSPTDNAGR